MSSMLIRFLAPVARASDWLCRKLRKVVIRHVEDGYPVAHIAVHRSKQCRYAITWSIFLERLRKAQTPYFYLRAV